MYQDLVPGNESYIWETRNITRGFMSCIVSLLDIKQITLPQHIRLIHAIKEICDCKCQICAREMEIHAFEKFLLQVDCSHSLSFLNVTKKQVLVRLNHTQFIKNVYMLFKLWLAIMHVPTKDYEEYNTRKILQQTISMLLCLEML